MNPSSLDLAQLYAALGRTGGTPAEIEAAIRVEAARAPQEFLAFLANLPFDDSCELFWVYAALIGEPTPHSTILLTEFERLLAAAHRAPRNPVIYSELSAFEMVLQSDALRCAVAAKVREALLSRTVQVRRYAAYLAGDFVLPDDCNLRPILWQLFEHDSDRRVRLLAHESLRDLHTDEPSSPAPPRPPLRDTILAWLLDRSIHSYMHDYAA